jgi:hypothetical protein
MNQTTAKTLLTGTPGYSNPHACSCTFLGYAPDGRLRVEFTPSEPECLLEVGEFDPDIPEPGDRINTDYAACVAMKNERDTMERILRDFLQAGVRQGIDQDAHAAAYAETVKFLEA